VIQRFSSAGRKLSMEVQGTPLHLRADNEREMKIWSAILQDFLPDCPSPASSPIGQSSPRQTSKSLANEVASKPAEPMPGTSPRVFDRSNDSRVLQLVNLCPELAMVACDQGKVIFMNSAAAGAFGLSADKQQKAEYGGIGQREIDLQKAGQSWEMEMPYTDVMTQRNACLHVFVTEATSAGRVAAADAATGRQHVSEVQRTKVQQQGSLPSPVATVAIATGDQRKPSPRARPPSLGATRKLWHSMPGRGNRDGLAIDVPIDEGRESHLQSVSGPGSHGIEMVEAPALRALKILQAQVRADDQSDENVKAIEMAINLLRKSGGLWMPEDIGEQIQRSANDSDTSKYLAIELGQGQAHHARNINAPLDAAAARNHGRNISLGTDPRDGDTSSSRGRSSVAPACSTQDVSTVSVPAFLNVSAIYNFHDWNCDILELSADPNVASQPLSFVAQSISKLHGFDEIANCSTETLNSFFACIESEHRDPSEVPYHCSIHGADVTHMMHLMVHPHGHGGGAPPPAESKGVCEIQSRFFQPKAVFAAVIAAIGHDVGHPGTNNGWQVEAQTSFALGHNDNSCLERHHCAVLFGCARRRGCNIFAGLSTADFKSIRSSILDMILHTDNAVHVQLLEKFKSVFTNSAASIAERAHARTAEQQLALNTLLHAADIGSSTKSWPIYVKWTDRLFEEFWAQGEMEKALFGQVAVSFMDKEQCNLAKCQVGFLQFLVMPLYSALSQVFQEAAMPLGQAVANEGEWQRRIQQQEQQEHEAAPDAH
jgi:hypothetical protein